MLSRYDITLFTWQSAYMVPIVLVFLYVILIFFRNKKYEGNPIARYMAPALTLRLASCLGNAVISEFYYDKVADLYGYFVGTLEMRRAISLDPGNFTTLVFQQKLNYLSNLAPYFNPSESLYGLLVPSNYTVVKISMLLSYLVDENYLCIAFLFSFFSFAGCWRLFKTFYYMYPHLHKQFAIACLFLPSVFFWGSGGILKDPLTLGGLGFFLHACYNIFFRRKNLMSSVVVALVSGYLVLLVKPYIILAFIPAMVMWVFLYNNARISDSSVRTVTGIVVFVMAAFVSFFFLQRLTSGDNESLATYSAENVLDAAQKLKTNYQLIEAGVGEGGSFYDLGDISSPAGVARAFPIGLSYSLFGPFLWNVRKPIHIPSSLEGMALLILTLFSIWKLGLVKFVRGIFARPEVAFCFIFSVIFLGAVAIGTSNFGTLVRYKIPGMPFFLIMLFLLLDRAKIKLPFIERLRLFEG